MGLVDYVMQDAYRIYDDNSLIKTVARYFLNISFRVRFQMRLIQYLERTGKWGRVNRILLKLYDRRNFKLGITLPAQTQIGAGVEFPHNFPVVVHYAAIIGENCIIHPNVQIGTTRGKEGVPVIGNNCFLGNGCHIIGNPKIGDWVFVSPGAFICKDIPRGSGVGFGVNNILSSKGKKTILMFQQH